MFVKPRNVRTLLCIALVGLLIALGVTACEQGAPQSQLARVVKTAKDAGVAAKVLVDKADQQRFQEVAAPVDDAALWKALKGMDEEKAYEALGKAGVGFVFIKSDQAKKAKPGSVLWKLANNGQIRAFSALLISRDEILFQRTAQAYLLDQAERTQVIANLRELIAGKQPTSWPDGFTDKLSQKAMVRLRLTDPEKGIQRTIGTLYADGPTVKEAVENVAKFAAGKIKSRGQLKGQSVEDFLSGQILTLNLFRERGVFTKYDRRLMDLQFSVGVEGLTFVQKEKSTVHIPAYKAMDWKTDSAPKFMQKAAKDHDLAKKVGETKDRKGKKSPKYEYAYEKGLAEVGKFRQVDLTEVTPKGEVLELYRQRELIPVEKMGRYELARGLKDGADWLMDNFHPQTKKFTYSYFARTGKTDTRNYNLIRHGLATLTLIQAYEIFGDEKYLEAGKLAIEFILDLVIWDKLRPKMAYFRLEKNDPTPKTGGAGVMLQAMCEYWRFKQEPGWEKVMKGLAEFIMFMNDDETGKYYSFLKPHDKEPNKKRDVWIYPGEANLALARMYGHFKDKRYLDTIENTLKFYPDWFRNGKSNKRKGNQAPYVPWEMSAMLEYWEHTKDQRALDFANDMAEWVVTYWQVEHLYDRYHPDFHGGYGRNQREWDIPVWNSGVYGEGVTSVWYLNKLAKVSDKQERWGKSVAAVARFIRQIQYQPGSQYWIPTPPKAQGCIPSNYFTDDCRLDFTYHCLTVNYRVLRWFTDEDYQAAGIRADELPDELKHASKRNAAEPAQDQGGER